VLTIAQEEAERLQHNYIGTEHLLLGLIKEDSGIAGRVLRELGARPERVSEMVERMTGAGRRAGGKLELTPRTKQVLEFAVDEARKLNHSFIGTEHILLGLIRQGDGVAIDVLKQLTITADRIRRETLRAIQQEQPEGQEGAAKPAASGTPDKPSSSQTRKDRPKTPALDSLATDLTALASQGKLTPVVGRVTEIERVIQILARRTKNNPALIGEPGVGKTAIVEGLAQRIVDGQTPELLLNKRVMQLDVGSLVAGTMYRGQLRAPQEGHRRDQGRGQLHPLRGRTPHARRRGRGRGRGRRRQHPQAVPRPRRTPVHRRNHLDEYRKHIERTPPSSAALSPSTSSRRRSRRSTSFGIRPAYEAHHKLRSG
jgi:ATP-dependent Clp protease ATP-binding subunit ClpC